MATSHMLKKQSGKPAQYFKRRRGAKLQATGVYIVVNEDRE
jgi:hypothetical protein